MVPRHLRRAIHPLSPHRRLRLLWNDRRQAIAAWWPSLARRFSKPASPLATGRYRPRYRAPSPRWLLTALALPEERWHHAHGDFDEGEGVRVRSLAQCGFELRGASCPNAPDALVPAAATRAHCRGLGLVARGSAIPLRFRFALSVLCTAAGSLV